MTYLSPMPSSRMGFRAALPLFFALVLAPSALAATHSSVSNKKPPKASSAASSKTKGPAPAALSLLPFPQNSLSYYSLNVSPGQSQTQKMVVVNTGDLTANGFMYVADAMTGQTSGAVYLLAGQKPQNIAPWFSLPISTLSLSPHKGIVFPFTVTVPKNAGSGQRLVGVVADLPAAKVTQHAVGQKNIRIVVQAQAIDAVLLNLGPPYICSPQLTGITATTYAKYQALELGILNASNVLVKGHGEITVTNSAGHVLRHQSIKLDTLVNDTSIQFPQIIGDPKPLPLGAYKVHVTIGFRGLSCVKTVNASFPLTIGSRAYYGTHGAPAKPPRPLISRFPWWIIGVALALLLLLLLLWRQRKPKADKPPIVSISAKDFRAFQTDDAKWKGGRVKSITYQWQRGTIVKQVQQSTSASDGVESEKQIEWKDIPEATQNKYKVTDSDIGKHLRSVVTAHGARHSHVSQESEATDVIVPLDQNLAETPDGPQ